MSPTQRKLAEMYSEATLPEDNMDRCLQRIQRLIELLEAPEDLSMGYVSDGFWKAVRENLRAETAIYVVMTQEIDK